MLNMEAVQHVFILLLPMLLCGIIQIGCEAAESTCPQGSYQDDQSLECVECQPCPVRALDENAGSGISLIHKCTLEMLCPRWCADPSTDNTSAICKTYDIDPSAKIMASVAFNWTTRTYNVTCTFTTSHVVIYQLELRKSSEVLFRLDDVRFRNGDFSFAIPVLYKRDEGNYTCKLAGHPQMDEEDTIFLKYEEPTTVRPTSKPTTKAHITKESTTDGGGKATKIGGSGGESRSPLGYTVLWIVGISVIVLIVVCAVLFIRWYKKSNSHHTSRDSVLRPLISSDLKLESSDFQTFSILGLKSLWNLRSSPTCQIKIKKNNTTIKTVTQTDIDTVCLEGSSIKWKDTVSVLVRSQTDIDQVIDLKFNCLIVPESEIQMTSAEIRCPQEDVFFMKLGEKKDDSSVHWLSSSAEEISEGRRRLGDLRPGKMYHVELSTKDQRGNFHVQSERDFKTKVPSLALSSLSCDGAALTVGCVVPDSPPVYLRVNGRDPTRVERQMVNVSELLPGCRQIVQLEVKEDDEYRVLHRAIFTTSGDPPPLLGCYKDDVTTDFAGYEDVQEASSERRKAAKDRKRKAAGTCNTGLQEAILSIRDNRRTFAEFYCRTDLTALGLMASSLQDLLCEKWGERPRVIPEVKDEGLAQVLDLLKQYNLTDVCGIFPILKRFLDREGFKSPRCMEFAKELHGAHYDTCDICSQYLLLLEFLSSNWQFSTLALHRL